MDHLRDLKQQLEEILKYWQAETLIGGALVSVYYNKIVAKSNRLKGLLAKGNLKPKASVEPNLMFPGNSISLHILFPWIF